MRQQCATQQVHRKHPCLIAAVHLHSTRVVQCAAAVDNLAGYFFKHQPGSESPTPAAAVSAWRFIFGWHVSGVACQVAEPHTRSSSKRQGVWVWLTEQLLQGNCWWQQRVAAPSRTWKTVKAAHPALCFLPTPCPAGDSGAPAAAAGAVPADPVHAV